MKNHSFYSPDNSDHFQKEERVLPTFGERDKVHFPTTEEVYEAVFDNSFHAAYIGTGEGKIIKFNEKLYKLLGYSKEEMIKVEGPLIFAMNEESFMNFINERNQKGIAKGRITCIRKSGERFPCKISSVTYKTDKGERRSLNTIIDVTGI